MPLPVVEQHLRWRCGSWWASDPASCHRAGWLEIGMAEIITLEQQGLFEIEAGAMTTLAEPCEGCACDFGLFVIQAHDADLCRAEKQIQIPLAIRPAERAQ